MAGAPEVGFRPTVPYLLRHVVEEYGARDFIVGPDDRMTYADADRRSSALARWLLGQGVTKGTRVAIRFGNTTEWVVLWLALSRIGAITMPFSTMYRPSELAQVFELSDAELYFTPRVLAGEDQAPYLEKTLPGLDGSSSPVHLPEVPYLRRLFLHGGTDWSPPSWAEAVTVSAPDSPPAWADESFLRAVEEEVSPADPMAIVFTSGTTAEPKAVVHSHGTWVRHTKNYADNTDEPFGRRMYGGMPFFWIGGLSSTIGTAMQRGHTIICAERPDPEVLADLLLRERPDVAMMWPNLLERVVLKLRERGLSEEELPLFARARTGPPPDMSHRAQSLGMTETCAGYIVSGPLDHVIPDEYLGAHGFKVPHMDYKIADPVTGETLPEGVEGEICVRGYALMINMYKKERHEYLDADGYYHTGDRGSLKGPYIYFRGRLKDLIKTSGANVAPREVEAVLNTAPGVLTSLVVGLPDPERGEIVGALIARRASADVDVAELVAICKDRLSPYKVPRRVAVIADDELPLSATGKAKVSAVRELIMERGTNV